MIGTHYPVLSSGDDSALGPTCVVLVTIPAPMQSLASRSNLPPAKAGGWSSRPSSGGLLLPWPTRLMWTEFHVDLAGLLAHNRRTQGLPRRAQLERDGDAKNRVDAETQTRL